LLATMSERDDQGMAYTFRFLRVDELTASALAGTLVAHQPLVRPRFEKQFHVVSLHLGDTVDGGALLQAMQQHGVESQDVDVFASLLAETDTDIIEVPDHVTRTLRITGAKLTFSFTYVGQRVNP
jgi:hypothetical protein